MRPKYIGIWTPETFKGRSVFFLEVSSHIQEKISGHILDRFGLANFRGRINPKKIDFEKVYEKKYSSTEAFPGQVYYTGKKHGSLYEGHYKGISIDGDATSGKFILETYPKSLTLNLIVKELFDNAFKFN